MRDRSCCTRGAIRRFLPAVLSLLFIIVILPPCPSLSQATTGVIRGSVLDAETGSPLHQVTLQLSHPDGTDTGLGTVSDETGRFVILNVPPGRYRLRATMNGYVPVETEGLSVQSGSTTRLDLTLEPASLEIGTVLTVAVGTDHLRRDVTSSKDTWTSTRMMDLPATSTSDILNMQTAFFFENGFTNDIPSYYDRGLQQLNLRGGRNAEVAFMIDGMQVTNLVFGGQALQTNPNALAEMVVMAGGMSAEFGNALSGVVNFVTRSGGSRYEGDFEILSSEMSGQQQDDVRDMTRARGSFGGPVPGLKSLTFFFSGSATTERDYLVERDSIVYDLKVDPLDPSTRREGIDYYDMPDNWDDFDYLEDNPYLQRETVTGNDWRIYPTDIYAGWLGYGYSNNHDILANVTARLRKNIRLKASWVRNRSDRIPFTNAWRYSMFWGIPQKIQDNCIWGTEKWSSDPKYADEPYFTGGYNRQSAIIPSTGLTDFHNEKNVVTKDHDRFALVWTHQPSQSVFYTLRGSYLDYNSTMRVKRWINEDGYVPRYEHLFPGSATADTLWNWGDAMTQVTLVPMPYAATDSLSRRFGYFPIGGAGYGNDGSDRHFRNQYDITRQVKLDVTAQAGHHHLFKAGFEYRSLTLDNYEIQLLYLTPPYITQYRNGPTEVAFYIQDRIEYPDLVMNIGLRFDTSDIGEQPQLISPRFPWVPTNRYRWPLNDPSNPWLASTHFDARRRSVSPRFGLSHPLSERSVLYLNYGHFYQMPIYRNLYLHGNLEDSNPILGNPDLEKERSSKYEIGLRSHLDEIHMISLILWGKKSSNLVGSFWIPGLYLDPSDPDPYTILINYDYATARGIDVALSRRLSRNWNGRLNYSFLDARTNRDDPWSGYRDGDELETSPKQSRPAKWDQPHTIAASFNLNLPVGSGPEIFGIKPFERLIMCLTYRGAAGRPYTPTTRERTLELNSGRLPWTHQWNLRIYRDLRLFGLDCGLLAQVMNLFDRRNTQSVYTRTGRPDDPGPEATSYSENYDRSWYFGPRRSIDIGLRVRFN